MLQVDAFANLVWDCRTNAPLSTASGAASALPAKPSSQPRNLSLLCPSPPPAAIPMITRRSEDKFSLIRKRRMKLRMRPSRTIRAQKQQAKEKRKDKNCRRRPLTSSVPFLCTALPSAAVGKCAHQYILKTEVCRHLAEKTDAIKPRHSKWRFLGAPVTTLVNTRRDTKSQPTNKLLQRVLNTSPARHTEYWCNTCSVWRECTF